MTRTKCRRVVQGMASANGANAHTRSLHQAREVRIACSGPARAVARAADRCAL